MFLVGWGRHLYGRRKQTAVPRPGPPSLVLAVPCILLTLKTAL